MKKIFSILFTVFYLSVTLGLTINIHYCHGIIQKVSLNKKVENCCCENESKTPDCCRNEDFLILLDHKEQLSVNHIHLLLPYHFIVSKHITQIDNNPEINTQFKYIPKNHPPPNQAVYKRNCSYIFYG